MNGKHNIIAVVRMEAALDNRLQRWTTAGQEHPGENRLSEDQTNPVRLHRIHKLSPRSPVCSRRLAIAGRVRVPVSNKRRLVSFELPSRKDRMAMGLIGALKTEGARRVRSPFECRVRDFDVRPATPSDQEATGFVWQTLRTSRLQARQKRVCNDYAFCRDKGVRHAGQRSLVVGLVGFTSRVPS